MLKTWVLVSADRASVKLRDLVSCSHWVCGWHWCDIVCCLSIQEKIVRMFYVWAFCRDQSVLDPRAAWRLIDLSASPAEQWLWADDSAWDESVVSCSLSVAMVLLEGPSGSKAVIVTKVFRKGTLKRCQLGYISLFFWKYLSYSCGWKSHHHNDHHHHHINGCLTGWTWVSWFLSRLVSEKILWT